MLKLWDSYESCQHYLDCSKSNGYTFGIAKVSPRRLEKERATNYQYLNPYYLTDGDIEELIGPTVNTLKDVISEDPRKSILFLRGVGLNADTVQLNNDSMGMRFALGLMINQDLIYDRYVRRKIYDMIKRRIDNAKIGVLDVHGNYAIICGDPYSLCQSMFGMEVTGLLNAGEIYHKFWVEEGAKEVACFRAPMSVHNNIVRMKIVESDEMAYWYQYMDTVVLLNSWDTATAALNGCDKDGDILFTTDNRVLVDNLRDLPALMCFQRKAKKTVPTEEILIQANIDSFGDDIGKVTNRITSMYDVQSLYDKDSEEYKVLEYRIMCGQQLQQNAIDKAKGIVAKPMPKTWYNRSLAMNDISIPEDKVDLYVRILADKKPYFMTYVYPDLKKEYATFAKNVQIKCWQFFKKDLKDLLETDKSDLSSDELWFVENYYKYIPVGIHDCVTNRICRRIESEFDGYLSKNKPDEDFDPVIFKSNISYSKSQYYNIRKIYLEYVKEAREYMKRANKERIDKVKAGKLRDLLIERFNEKCSREVPNRWQLCNIIVDMCYQKEGSKQFAWDIVGEEMLLNLLRRNDYKISYPTANEDGDICWKGEYFSFETTTIDREGVWNDDYFE